MKQFVMSYNEYLNELESLENYYSNDEHLQEKIKKENGEYVVYPKKGGKRLGTHKTKKEALKQLAAIEISKRRRKS